jgi:hypothetical protein
MRRIIIPLLIPWIASGWILTATMFFRERRSWLSRSSGSPKTGFGQALRPWNPDDLHLHGTVMIAFLIGTRLTKTGK